MKVVIDICGENRYSPLIPAIEAICNAQQGDTLEITLNDPAVFSDLKTYLSEQEIGFREVYDGDYMILEFTKPQIKV